MKAIITGASKGIGKATAALFLEKGIDIAINSRSQSDLEAVRDEFRQSFPEREILIKATDVSKKDEVYAFGEFVKSQWSAVDYLINNAGQYVPGQIHDEEDDVLESQIDTNLYSAVRLTKSILPVMLPQKKGTIVNISSIAGIMAYPNSGSYSVSKFALQGFSKVLRDELKDKGIRVVSVLPGATWTCLLYTSPSPRDRG